MNARVAGGSASRRPSRPQRLCTGHESDPPMGFSSWLLPDSEGANLLSMKLPLQDGKVI